MSNAISTLNRYSGLLTLIVALITTGLGVAANQILAKKSDLVALAQQFEAHTEQKDIHRTLAEDEEHFVTVNAYAEAEEAEKREREHTDRQFDEIKEYLIRLDEKISNM